MDTKKLEETLKSLSLIRDHLIEMHNPDNQVEDLFLMQLNIFTSTFFFAITDLKKEAADLTETYIAYSRSRQSPVRYLLEIYLTMVHLYNFPKEERKGRAYSFYLSGKLGMHSIALKVKEVGTQMGVNNVVVDNQIDWNRESYKKFIKKNGKISDLIPESIDDFFNGSQLVEGCEKKFNIALFKHNKINYSEEIRQNPLIPEVLRRMLSYEYPSLSLDIHPTAPNLIDFEVFIGKSEDEKREVVKNRNNAHGGLTQLIGAEVISLYKSIVKDHAEGNLC
jgi:hypothetical protein